MIKKVENNTTEFRIKAKTKNIGFKADFLRKLFKIAVWLNDRYEVGGGDVVFDQEFESGDKDKGLITIRLIFFHGKA